LSARILVIDDETNIRLMMRLALEHVGYSVEPASDGQEGLQKFGDGTGWDLVLLDHRMPGMTGTEVQHEILKRHAATRIIMVTAFGTISLALEAIQAGASDFLRKPFTAETLRQAVKAALEKPAQKLKAVPVGLAMREFTRTTINGFSFNMFEEVERENSYDVECIFEVSRGSETPSQCKVVLPVYVQELALAHADTESMPGGKRFWQAMCEEALANFLWQHAEMPPNNTLLIDDLTSSLRHWMDAVLTVECSKQNAN
jgi:DNA-binding response OmpR family regulator